MNSAEPEPLPFEDLLRLTFFAIRKYRAHPEWEDLLQIGLVGAWEALRSPTARGWKPSTVVIRGAQFAVADYLRSPQALRPKLRNQDEPIPIVSLTDHEWQTIPDTTDFTETILAKLAHRQLQAEIKACCTSRQWEMIHRHLVVGQTLTVIAKDEKTHPSRIYQLIRDGLKKYRRRYGIEPPPSRRKTERRQ